MAIPSANEFLGLIQSQELRDIVDAHLFSGLPYAFLRKPSMMAMLRDHLSRNLNIDPNNVYVVGSGKLGYSLNPARFSAPFSRKSDLDIAVIDANLFDHVWLTALEWHYPFRAAQSRVDDVAWPAIRELYWGWFFPNRVSSWNSLWRPSELEPMREFSTDWFNTFQSVSRIPDFASRAVKGRLYRSIEHAKLYHIDGLRQIRQDVASSPYRVRR